MIGWVKKVITAVYHWFCYWLLCRKEYFTPQLTRLMIHHGIFFWFIFYIIAGFCFYHIFIDQIFWKSLLCVAGLVGLSWLSDHLNDHARNNPELYKD